MTVPTMPTSQPADSAAAVPGFFDGSPAFNFIDLLIGVAGLVLTLYAMFAASRAARAATAAKTEVELAREQMRTVQAGMELGVVSGNLREALARLDAGQYGSVAICLRLVRTGLARASRLPLGSTVASPAQWQQIDTTLAQSIEAILERSSPDPSLIAAGQVLTTKLLEIETHLARMQALAEVAASGD